MKNYILPLNFRFLLSIPILFFFPFFVIAQTYYPVTHTNGTQVIGGISVTVKPIGCASGNSLSCGLNTYSTHGFSFCLGSPGAYRFIFSSPVAAVRSNITSINHVNANDTMLVYLNGSFYSVNNSDLSYFQITPCVSNFSNSVYSSNGYIVSNASNPDGGSTQFNLQPNYAIDSIEIGSSLFTPSQSPFDFYFALPCPGALSASASHDSLCSGDSLYLSAAISGMSGAATYSWSGPNGFSSTALNPPGLGSIDTAASGLYVLTVTDTGICTYHSSVNVHVTPAPAFTAITSNSPLCVGDSLQLTVNSLQSSFSTNWSGPSGFADTNIHSGRPHMQFTDSGYYSITATGQNNCTRKDSVFVSVRPVPVIPIAGSNTPVCAGDTLKFIVGNFQSGVVYSWAGPASFSAATQNPIRTNAQSSYTGTYTVVANLNGCTESSTTAATVNPQLGPPSINITATPDTICAGGNVMLNASVSNAINPVYHWRKNNSNIGPNAAGFSTAVVGNGDVFRCEVSSSSTCQAVDTALSNAVTMHVLFIAPPVISISVYPTTYSNGDTVTFTGHVPTGSTGLTYAWTKNGVKINSANASIYTTNNISAGDSICFIAYSSVPCTIPDSSTACWGLSLGIDNLAPPNILIYPNPVSNELNIEGAAPGTLLNIYDIVGHRIYTAILGKTAGINTSAFSKGSYLLELTSPKGERTIHKIVK